MGKPRIGGKIEVTADLIAAAMERDSSHCMVADAVRTRHPKAREVYVDLQLIRYTDRVAGKRYVWLTPQIAQSRLIKFDQGDPVEPFEFTLRMPIQEVPIRAKTQADGQSRHRAHTPGPSQLVPGAGEFGRLKRVGGLIPPVAVLSNARGRVRGFGLRQLIP